MEQLKNMIDISWPITANVTSYKDNKGIGIVELKSFKEDGVRDTNLIINTHTGTHVDAPSHFLADEEHIESIPLQKLSGACQVIDLTHIDNAITKEHLEEKEIKEESIILLKTKNSSLPSTGSFHTDFIYLEKSGAEYLVQQKIKAVGIDYLGIERNQPDHETHTQLLEAGIPIIEGLRLAKADAKNYTLLFLPLALHGVEASPGRAILLP